MALEFFRAGGLDQARFQSGRDLLDLAQLDQTLWVALACPTKGLSIDARTLELIDADADGRIRAPELLAAVKWATSLLTDPDQLSKGSAELPLAAIAATDEGQRIRTAANTVLQGLGKAGATTLSVKDSSEAVKAFHAMPFNGDGVITEKSATTDAQRALIADVLAVSGGADDKCGSKGVTAEQVAALVKSATAYARWLDESAGQKAAMVLGDQTPAAFDAIEALRAKVDDFFTRCRLAAFDPRAEVALNREEKELIAIGAKDLSLSSVELRALPLARVVAGRALPLYEAVNPGWEAAVADLAKRAVVPLLGDKRELTQAEWADLTARFVPFATWRGTKPGEPAVEKLGAERLRAIAKDGVAVLEPLFTLEKAQEPTAQSIASVERLVRYGRDLYRLVNNFAAFKDFYERKTPAVFQIGTLFLDRRACELCIRVEDAAKHATMAPLSNACLAYCDCVRASGEKMTIVAALTAGDSDDLIVGRNGIFYDLDGKDWDATITKIVDNPISVRQAFWSPYKKLVRFIEEQIAKRAGDADKDSQAMLQGGATNVGKAAETGAVAGPKPIDIGVVAALGVAVGGITAALGAVLQSMFGLGMWMPLGLLGIMLLISGPSMLLALLKLRRRNIGRLLDANGWAVNANARLNVPFGASLTRVAKLPAGARVDTNDPYAEARRPWGLYVAIVLVIGTGISWYLGRLDRLLPPVARSVTVLGADAPASQPPPAPPAAVPAPATK